MLNGLQLYQRNDEEFSTVASQNKKKSNKKKGGNNRSEVLSHGVDTLDSFSLLDIQPPRNIASIQQTINLLKLKRGAIETLATRLKNERENKIKESKKEPKVHNFNLEVDFPDLAFNTSSSSIATVPLDEITA